MAWGLAFGRFTVILMCMVINKTNRIRTRSSRRVAHATNHEKFVGAFLFYYRCHADANNKAWAIGGKTGHFVFHNGCNERTRLYGRWHDNCIGFFDLGNGMVRVIGGIFSVDPKVARWNTFSTTDLPKEEARAAYAASRDFTWRGSVIVPQDNEFI